MVDDLAEQEARFTLHRQSARTLRRLAAEIRFDFCRREQLLALADGFERLAERVKRSGIKETAD